MSTLTVDSMVAFKHGPHLISGRVLALDAQTAEIQLYSTGDRGLVPLPKVVTRPLSALTKMICAEIVDDVLTEPAPCPQTTWW